MNDYRWTTGDIRDILHRRVIDRGGYGEVHEMFNQANNQVFARKIVRPFGSVTEGDIENEFRAIQELLKGDHSHLNIIAILEYGWLSNPFRYFFLDMELCQFNLDDYIHGERSTLLDALGSLFTNKSPDDFVLVRKGGSFLLPKIENVWIICNHIAQGLEFIHRCKQVHRDLKPRNVLYSCEKNVWKITDFGSCAEATSKQAQTTVFSRGTASYRAPEVIAEQGLFTNKVDIFALSCVLYEIVAFKKAFKEDWAVREYAMRETEPPDPEPLWPEPPKEDLLKSLRQLLHRDWQQRLSASEAAQMFQVNRSNLAPLTTPFKEGLSYDEWKRKETLINTCKNIPDNEMAINGWQRLLRLYPKDTYLCDELITAYKRIGNLDVTIAGLKELLHSFLNSRNLIHELRIAYAKKGDSQIELAGWSELFQTYPDRTEFASEVLRVYKSAGNEPPIEVWAWLSVFSPGEWEYQYELATALEAKAQYNSAVRIWKKAVQTFPQCANLAIRLSDALSRNGDNELAIEVWKDLIPSNPSSIILQDGLAKAYREIGDSDIAIQGWKQLMKNHPETGTLRLQLAELYRAKDDDVALKSLVVDNPDDWELQSMLAEVYEKNGEKDEAKRVWQAKADRWQSYVQPSLAYWASHNCPSESLSSFYLPTHYPETIDISDIRASSRPQ